MIQENEADSVELAALNEMDVPAADPSNSLVRAIMRAHKDEVGKLESILLALDEERKNCSEVICSLFLICFYFLFKIRLLV